MSVPLQQSSRTPTPARGARTRLVGLAGAPALSLASQVAGLVQIVLLTRGGASGLTTDAYLFLYGVGLLPGAILLDGLLYPTALNPASDGTRIDRLVRWAAPLLCVGGVGIGALWLAANGRLPTTLVGLVVLIGVNAAVNNIIWRTAVHQGVAGEARWYAALMLPANVVACVLLALPWATVDGRTEAMVAGLLLGNLGFALAVHRWKSSRAPVDLRATVEAGSAAVSGWFLARAVTSYGALTAVQGLAALLPPSSITAIAVMYRLVGSGVATFVNALVPKFVNLRSESGAPALRFSLGLMVLGAIPLAGTIAVALLTAWEYRAYAVLVALWAIVAGVGATTSRLASRELAPNRSAFTIGSSILVVIALTMASQQPFFGLPTLILGAVLLDFLPAIYVFVVLGASKHAWLLILEAAIAVSGLALAT